MGTNVFVGRQPILDSNGNLFAYELLYRNSEQNIFPGIDPDKATISLLINTFLSIGVDKVSGGSPSFINFTGKLLSRNLFDNLDPDRVVIEILEDVEITPDLITKLRSLKRAGFKLALDDFILQKQFEIHRDLFKLIDFVKVDFLNTTFAERNQIKRFINKFPHIWLLAEKVETEAQFISAKRAGYRLFQGYFFAKPEIVIGTDIPSNVGLHVQIIESLNAETPNISKIAGLIMHDMSLTYKMLRYINTLGVGIPKKVKSVKQAIVIIGLRETEKWVHVIALHEMGVGSGKGRIKALVDYSLTRAKLCELLAKRAGKKNSDEYFLAGMFSLMDVIMKRGWDDILPNIPLTDEVIETLSGRLTEITPYIQLAESIERFELERTNLLAKELGINLTEISQCSLQANRWTQRID